MAGRLNRSDSLRGVLRTSRDVFRLRDDDTVEVKLCLHSTGTPGEDAVTRNL